MIRLWPREEPEPEPLYPIREVVIDLDGMTPEQLRLALEGSDVQAALDRKGHR